ncbi:unnamed protein product, partial [Meganyctiphanes norvegica]
MQLHEPCSALDKGDNVCVISINAARRSPLAAHGRKVSSTGCLHSLIVLCSIHWYFFSEGVFSNKYFFLHIIKDPNGLCSCGMQMFITMICGFIQMRYPLGTYKPTPGQRKPQNFIKSMVTVGFLQLGTIMFGLVAIYFVAVSFAETVKSSAPLFTVLISWMVLREKTGLFVFLSLLPIMFGLALCSSHELSFSLMGFICAMSTNLCECVQSVVSKSLLSSKAYKYNPAELQFYPNMVAVLIQFPMWLFLVDFDKLQNQMDFNMFATILIDGISFHGQTLTAYVLMSYVNPVTYSVANTTKRAVLIWLSVLMFGNPITLFSGIGTAFVVGGVLLYNKARDVDARRREQFSIPKDKMDDIR